MQVAIERSFSRNRLSDFFLQHCLFVTHRLIPPKDPRRNAASVSPQHYRPSMAISFIAWIRSGWAL